MDSNLLTALITASGSLLLSVITFFIGRIDQKTTMEKLKAIKQSDLKGLYIVCPKCGTKVALSNNPIIMEVNSDVSEKK